ncbi:MAG: tRNA (guanosine(37)-N1)-methyltransferase TrmD [Helicobacter sp.]|nr:tRNA (guanosine(37)-N1)-methyltransferase TrmD [Helicobacter sp.]
MRFLSLFPDLILSHFKEGILNIALNKKLFELEVINLRNFANNAYKKVDSAQISGGAGQVLDFAPLSNALSNLSQSHIIFLTPSGKQFSNLDAMRLSKRSDLTIVCGRYEGFDERAIEQFCDEAFSIGDFILMGGELAGLCISECILRQIDGVLGNAKSLKEESFENNLLEAPVFSQNKMDKNAKNGAPNEFFSGNHAKISDLKRQLSLFKTQYVRPDLYKRRNKEN